MINQLIEVGNLILRRPAFSDFDFPELVFPVDVRSDAQLSCALLQTVRCGSFEVVAQVEQFGLNSSDWYDAGDALGIALWAHQQDKKKDKMAWAKAQAAKERENG